MGRLKSTQSQVDIEKAEYRRKLDEWANKYPLAAAVMSNPTTPMNKGWNNKVKELEIIIENL